MLETTIPTKLLTKSYYRLRCRQGEYAVCLSCMLILGSRGWWSV